ncbi:MAG: hypothetical protein COA91_04835 [Robiginitomaculum sp.]|nr:MAG: hypothetical protein COA91_04835 [Robiginitomaculum sp.]
MHNFNETRPEFKGFSKFYEQNIHPFLQKKELQRQEKLAKGKQYGTITAGVIVLIGVFIALKFGIFLVAAFVGAVGILCGFGVLYGMVSKLRGQTKQILMSNICTFLGWSFQAKDFVEPDLSLWKTNKLLPGWDRVNFEDQMSGTVNGTEFTFCEAHLETRHKDNKGNTTWRTAFRGILFEVGFQREFLGRTVVLRDAGFFNFKKKAGMKRVGLVDPKFEKIFEAYGTDQVEARYLLTPTFMQKLVDLETSVSGKKIRFGFLKDKLHIAVEAPNQFEAGSMFKPLTGSERTEKILTEIGAVLDVINGVRDAKRQR